MKYMPYLLSLLFILPIEVNAQTQEPINLKGKWFIGAELGSNTILSYTLGEPTTSAQGGILAEYYVTRSGKVSGRIKYFKTGVSFFIPGDTSSFGWITEGYSGTFHGSVVSMPVNIVYELKLLTKLRGFVSSGLAFNLETKSNYSNYSSNIKSKYSKGYLSINAGLGFNYYINSNTSIYMGIEAFIGGLKGRIPSFIFDDYYYTTNLFGNIGVKSTIPRAKK